MNKIDNRAWMLAELEQANAAAAWHAHVTATARQPQVDATLTLLATGYDHDGLLLDLYGTSDKDGIEVEDVALTGDKRSLAPLFSGKQLDDLGYWCERKAEREHAAGALDRALDKAHDRSEERRG